MYSRCLIRTQVLVDDAADIGAFKDYQPSGSSSAAGSAEEPSQEAASTSSGVTLVTQPRGCCDLLEDVINAAICGRYALTMATD